MTRPKNARIEAPARERCKEADPDTNCQSELESPASLVIFNRNWVGRLGTSRCPNPAARGAVRFDQCRIVINLLDRDPSCPLNVPASSLEVTGTLSRTKAGA